MAACRPCPPKHIATERVRCAQGLGELYEEDYQKAAGFAAEDADEPLRQEVSSGCSSLQGPFQFIALGFACRHAGFFAKAFLDHSTWVCMQACRVSSNCRTQQSTVLFSMITID